MLDARDRDVAEAGYRSFLVAGSSCSPDPGSLASAKSGIAPGAPHLGSELPAIAPWYVARVHTGARDVQRARLELAMRGFETFFPRWVDHTRQGSIVRPYFVGYLFVACDDGLWGEAARAPGVVALLGNRLTGFAAQVPDEHMDRWRDRCGPTEVHDPVPIPVPVKRLPPGQTVRVMQGPMTGLHALVKLDEGARIQALLSILGGERVVELRREQLEAV